MIASYVSRGSLLPAIFCLCAASLLGLSSAQIRIAYVYTQINFASYAYLRNFGPASVDVAGYTLCGDGVCQSAITSPFVLGPNQEMKVTLADLVNTSQQRAEVSLFDSSPPSATSIIDYLRFGNWNLTEHANWAVARSLWKQGTFSNYITYLGFIGGPNDHSVDYWCSNPLSLGSDLTGDQYLPIEYYGGYSQGGGENASLTIDLSYVDCPNPSIPLDVTCNFNSTLFLKPIDFDNTMVVCRTPSLSDLNAAVSSVSPPHFQVSVRVAGKTYPSNYLTYMSRTVDVKTSNQVVYDFNYSAPGDFLVVPITFGSSTAVNSLLSFTGLCSSFVGTYVNFVIFEVSERVPIKNLLEATISMNSNWNYRFSSAESVSFAQMGEAFNSSAFHYVAFNPYKQDCSMQMTIETRCSGMEVDFGQGVSSLYFPPFIIDLNRLDDPVRVSTIGNSSLDPGPWTCKFLDADGVRASTTASIVDISSSKTVFDCPIPSYFTSNYLDVANPIQKTYFSLDVVGNCSRSRKAPRVGVVMKPTVLEVDVEASAYGYFSFYNYAPFEFCYTILIEVQASVLAQFSRVPSSGLWILQPSPSSARNVTTEKICTPPNTVEYFFLEIYGNSVANNVTLQSIAGQPVLPPPPIPRPPRIPSPVDDSPNISPIDVSSNPSSTSMTPGPISNRGVNLGISYLALFIGCIVLCAND